MIPKQKGQQARRGEACGYGVCMKIVHHIAKMEHTSTQEYRQGATEVGPAPQKPRTG